MISSQRKYSAVTIAKSIATRPSFNNPTRKKISLVHFSSISDRLKGFDAPTVKLYIINYAYIVLVEALNISYKMLISIKLFI